MPQVLPRCPGSGEVSLKGATRQEWRGALAPTLSASSGGAWGSTSPGAGVSLLLPRVGAMLATSGQSWVKNWVRFGGSVSG